MGFTLPGIIGFLAHSQGRLSSLRLHRARAKESDVLGNFEEGERGEGVEGAGGLDEGEPNVELGDVAGEFLREGGGWRVRVGCA